MSMLIYTFVIGVGATLTMDVWGWVRKILFGLAPPNYAMVGRWLGHMLHGQFRHQAIGAAATIKTELVVGWIAHYLIGISFAGVLIGIWGGGWLQSPGLFPPLLVGLGTIVAPLCIMQPAMGAGLASRLTPRPWFARLHSVITHLVFGLGLYGSAWLMHSFNLIQV